MSKQTRPETHFTDNRVVDGIIKFAILIALIAGVCFGLWWLGNWIWDLIVAFFGWLFGGGGETDLYQKWNDCYDKHPDDITAYRRCVRD